VNPCWPGGFLTCRTAFRSARARPTREPGMIGIIAIVAFIAVIFALNIIEFGRPD
jgi:hypothetical protein